MKQRDGLAHKLCNVALEFVIRVKSTVFYKLLQSIGFVGDINITGRTKRAVSEELKQRGKEVGLSIRVEKNRNSSKWENRRNKRNIDN